MMLSWRRARLLSPSGSGDPETSAAESSASSKGGRLGCRLVQIALAVYLLPALLVVLLVGATGMLAMGTIRLLNHQLESGSD